MNEHMRGNNVWFLFDTKGPKNKDNWKQNHKSVYLNSLRALLIELFNARDMTQFLSRVSEYDPESV